MERKEYKNEGMEEIKAFVKTYWKEMLFPALGAGIFVGVLTNRGKKKNRFGLRTLAEMVDEDIYTELAPKIEQAVLNNGIKSAVFDRSYDLADHTHKVVRVSVETINGD